MSVNTEARLNDIDMSQGGGGGGILSGVGGGFEDTGQINRQALQTVTQQHGCHQKFVEKHTKCIKSYVCCQLFLCPVAFGH